MKRVDPCRIVAAIELVNSDLKGSDGTHQAGRSRVPFLSTSLRQHPNKKGLAGPSLSPGVWSIKAS